MSHSLNGALLVNKHPGVTSFGIIELLQKQYMENEKAKKRDLPKIGHGGTLDPFATGLLIVCVGKAVKLARYFLGSSKTYEGVIRFGETTIPGDPTAPISETSTVLPESIESLQKLASNLTLQPYLQTPPMHSAKKKDGKPLYELARAGIEVEREPKLCHLYEFDISSYEKPRAKFKLVCSSGTYVRTLAQDMGRLLGTVALLESLERSSCGALSIAQAWSVELIGEAFSQGKKWDELPCWVPFDRLLDSYHRTQATPEEVKALSEGRQNVLFNILNRAEPPRVALNPRPYGQDAYLAIYCSEKLVAVAHAEDGKWGLERVFS